MRDRAGEAKLARSPKKTTLGGEGIATAHQRLEGAPGAGATEDQKATAEGDDVEPVAQAAEREAERRQRGIDARIGDDDDAAAGALAGVTQAAAGLRVKHRDL